VPILLVEQNLAVVRQLAAGAIILSGGKVVHRTESATDFLNDEALTQRFLGVQSEDAVEQSIETTSGGTL
jgi:branched-chain amino acid transport system ATP-binding protein